MQRDDPALYSPLELSIRRVLDQRKASGTWDQACLDQEACERYQKTQGADADEQRTVYTPEMPSDELVEMLGFTSFGKKRRKQAKGAKTSNKRAAITV